MKTLPAESRETAQSFRKMYTEEKELKAQGPEAILKHAEKKKKKKTPEEEAKEARDRAMKPLVDLHNELSKMKGWQLRESRAAWDALVATELAEKRAAEAADLQRRTKNVKEALSEVAVDTSKGALRLERAKDKSLKKKERARRKDRKDRSAKDAGARVGDRQSWSCSSKGSWCARVFFASEKNCAQAQASYVAGSPVPLPLPPGPPVRLD